MEIKFKAKSKDGRIYHQVICGNTITDDPCSAVWNDETQLWTNFDKACGEVFPYIGLKDKNGKEIYLNDDVNQGLDTYKIIFKNGAFGMYLDYFISFAELIKDESITVVNNCIQEIEVVDD